MLFNWIKNIIAKISTAIIIVVFLINTPLLGGNPWEVDPNQNRQQDMTDLEKFSRSRTNPLNAQDIKDRKESLQTAKSLLAKNEKSSLEIQLGEENPKENSVQIQAKGPLGDFADNLKSTILNQLKGSNQKEISEDQFVIVEAVMTGNKTIQVSRAEIIEGKTILPTKETKAQSQPIAHSEGLGDNVTPLLPQSKGVDNSLKGDASLLSQPATIMPPQMTPDKSATAIVAPISSPSQDPRVVQFLKSDIYVVAQNVAKDLGARSDEIQGVILVGDISTNPRPMALIGGAGGKSILVTEVKEMSAGRFAAVIQSRFDDLPKIIQGQVQAKLPQGQAPAQYLEVSLVIRSNSTFIVDKVKELKTETAVNVIYSSPKNVADIKNLPTSQSIQQIKDFKSVAAVMGAKINQPDQLVTKMDKTFNSDIGPVTGAIFLFENNRPLEVFAVSANLETGETTYSASSTFGDLSTAVKTEVLNILAEFGGRNTINDKTSLEIQVIKTNENAVTTVSIRLEEKDPESQEIKETVLIWGKNPEIKNEKVVLPGEERKLAFLPGTNIPQLTLQPVENPGRPSLVKKETQLAKGILPAAEHLAVKGFDLKPRQFQFTLEQKDSAPQLVIHLNKSKKDPIKFNWIQASLEESRFNFSIEESPIVFTKEIQEKIFALLKEAAQKGEDWAKKALEDKSKVLIDLESAPDENGNFELAVKSVSPVLDEAVILMGQYLGLNRSDYNTLINQQKGIIQPLQGKTIQLTIEPYGSFKFRSPDGGIYILVRKNPLKKDQPLTLFLSRQALVANQNIINKLNGENSAGDLLSKNPTTKEFSLQINSSEGTGGVQLTALNKPRQLNEKSKIKNLAP